MGLSTMPVSLNDIVRDFALSFEEADAAAPVWISRTGRSYQSGLGPHAEDAAVRLTLARAVAATRFGGRPVGQGLPYPRAPRQKADLWIGDPVEWVIEVKMARFYGDNGKPDDTAIKDLLSPYSSDRSALTDFTKLAASGFKPRRATLVYGFDTPSKPLDLALDALERLAAFLVQIGPRHEASLEALMHPVHARGRVAAWEVLDGAL